MYIQKRSTFSTAGFAVIVAAEVSNDTESRISAERMRITSGSKTVAVWQHRKPLILPRHGARYRFRRVRYLVFFHRTSRDIPDACRGAADRLRSAKLDKIPECQKTASIVIPAESIFSTAHGCRIKACPGLDPGSGAGFDPGSGTKFGFLTIPSNLNAVQIKDREVVRPKR